MKKTIWSALVGIMTLVMSASASPASAASPFSDVPDDHWAYDAVGQLSADGIIEGYGDGTYRGDRNITRYEMAQMVARAMARTDVSGADQALIDKLAAEFGEELNNLGIRVTNLEKYSDKVVWHGKMEYTYKSTRNDNWNDSDDKGKINDNGLIFRLEPKAEINKNWTANARIDGHFKLDKDDNDYIRMKRGWAQGDYKNTQIKLGRFQIKPAHEHGLVWDTEMSGAMVSFGKDVKLELVAGRVDNNTVEGLNNTDNNTFLNAANRINDSASSMQGIRVQYDPKKDKGFTAGLAYYRVINDNFAFLKNGNRNLVSDYLSSNRTAADLTNMENNWKREDQANIWAVNVGYKFNKKTELWANYANNPNVDYEKDSWQAQLTYGDYKDAQKKGTWNVYAGYRKFGYGATVAGTVGDDVQIGTKGLVIGGAYAPMKNVGIVLKYFKGKNITGGGDASRIFARIEMFY